MTLPSVVFRSDKAGGLRGLRQGGAQFAARGDAELGEDLAQVPFDRARAEVQLHADLRVGAAVASQPGDVGLLRVQRGGLGSAPSQPLAGGGSALGGRAATSRQMTTLQSRR